MEAGGAAAARAAAAAAAKAASLKSEGAAKAKAGTAIALDWIASSSDAGDSSASVPTATAGGIASLEGSDLTAREENLRALLGVANASRALPSQLPVASSNSNAGAGSGALPSGADSGPKGHSVDAAQAKAAMDMIGGGEEKKIGAPSSSPAVKGADPSTGSSVKTPTLSPRVSEAANASSAIPDLHLGTSRGQDGSRRNSPAVTVAASRAGGGGDRDVSYAAAASKLKPPRPNSHSDRQFGENRNGQKTTPQKQNPLARRSAHDASGQGPTNKKGPKFSPIVNKVFSSAPGSGASSGRSTKSAPRTTRSRTPPRKPPHGDASSNSSVGAQGSGQGGLAGGLNSKLSKSRASAAASALRDGYVCRLCNIPGHHITACDQFVARNRITKGDTKRASNAAEAEARAREDGGEIDGDAGGPGSRTKALLDPNGDGQWQPARAAKMLRQKKQPRHPTKQKPQKSTGRVASNPTGTQAPGIRGGTRHETASRGSTADSKGVARSRQRSGSKDDSESRIRKGKLQYRKNMSPAAGKNKGVDLERSLSPLIRQVATQKATNSFQAGVDRRASGSSTRVGSAAKTNASGSHDATERSPATNQRQRNKNLNTN
eukprot:INCI3155.13.p1 GENE.INCI3155.13~~INCI3155.13.p1  ORF type:complete len:635 (-),score=120.80 INCI3155.13:2142-3953(-)